MEIVRAVGLACTIALALTAGLGCTPKGGHGETGPDAAGEVELAKPPRYWLWNTEVLSSPDGHPRYEVIEPTLVELRSNGHVRAVPGAAKQFEGFLPHAVLEAPGDQQGLMLYVQRQADLHFESPEGQTFARLHPGAFVSVAPAEGPKLLVGNLGFWAVRWMHGGRHRDFPVVGWVDRTVLGPEPRPIVEPRPRGRGVAVMHGTMIDFRGMPPGDPLQVVVYTQPCRPIWVPESESRSQFVDGVELLCGGTVLDLGSIGWPPCSITTRICPAHTVHEAGGELVHSTPSTRRRTPAGDWNTDSAPVTEIPRGYLRVELPSPDPLAAAMMRGGSIYLLWENGYPLEGATRDKPELLCSEWRFEVIRRWTEPGQAAHMVDGRLLIRPTTEIRLSRVDVHAHYRDFRYELSRGREPARLGLGAFGWNYEGRELWSCTEQDPTLPKRRVGSLCCPGLFLGGKCVIYSLLRVEGGELHMLGRPFPEPIVAYDPGDAERWFLTRPACELALQAVREQIDRDWTTFPRLGLHVR